jgi:hypothetical protein
MDRNRVVAALVAGLGLLLSFAAAPAAGQAPSRAETAGHLKQLQALFDAWDLNHDGYLDRHELALAFGTPNVKVSAAPQKGAAPAPGKSRVGPTSLVLVSLPRPAPPVNFTIADLLARLLGGGPGPSAPAGAGAAVPADQQFLSLLGQPGQTRISKKSFSTWAKKHVRGLYLEWKAAAAVGQAQAKARQAQLTIQEAQFKLKQAGTAKAVQKAEKELQKRVRDLEKAQANLQKRLQELSRAAAQLAAIPPAVRQALALKQ